MIAARRHHQVPTQCVMLEQGPNGGNPGSGAVINSAWFDTFYMTQERIIVPQTGAIVDGASEAFLGAGLTARAGLYVMDIFSEHTNAPETPYTLQVLGEVHAALLLATLDIAIYTFTVPASPAAGPTLPFTQSLRIQCPFVRVRISYPATASTRFRFSAVLRSS